MNTNDKLINDLAPQKFGKLGVIWTSTLIVIIIITVTTTNSYHTWTGRSHYCANCGSKKCNCGKKERYTTGCGCGA